MAHPLAHSSSKIQDYKQQNNFNQFTIISTSPNEYIKENEIPSTWDPLKLGLLQIKIKIKILKHRKTGGHLLLNQKLRVRLVCRNSSCNRIVIHV